MNLRWEVKEGMDHNLMKLDEMLFEKVHLGKNGNDKLVIK